MRAMVLHSLGSLDAHPDPLVAETRPDPSPGPGEVLLRISACGVCHTELDEIEGRTPPPRLPVIPGHQVVGTVVAAGRGVGRSRLGARVGVGWFFAACGTCAFCRRGLENLCPDFRATGRDADGGYAELMAVPDASAVPIPDAFSDVEAAPLLCAGAVGYRSLKLANLPPAGRLGLTGFGASAHLVLQMARHLHPDSDVFVFARNPQERRFALELGATWAGDTADVPPAPPEAIIDTTPVWTPVVEAMRRLAPGGRLVINAIRKEATDKPVLLGLDYADHLWLEKEIKSVANVTRRDISEFLALADGMGIRPAVQEYALGEANVALQELKHRTIRGAKVLRLG